MLLTVLKNDKTAYDAVSRAVIQVIEKSYQTKAHPMSILLASLALSNYANDLLELWHKRMLEKYPSEWEFKLEDIKSAVDDFFVTCLKDLQNVAPEEMQKQVSKFKSETETAHYIG